MTRKLCAIDCVPNCANCRHWRPADRFMDREASCAITTLTVGDLHVCEEFDCVNREEVEATP